MKKILLPLSLHLLGVAALNAQIHGSVKDDQGHAVSNATVSLLKAKDSSVVKLGLSVDGNFGFHQVAKDSFFISVSYVGHQPFFSKAFSYNAEPITLATYNLSSAKSRLGGITVVARKKMLEIKADRTILNVEGAINAAGSDALELLRKSPGVSVDKDENLAVNGKNGVQVYVDNKPMPLNGQDLSGYLKAIPASQIEAIEIIHNPGAMYEAAGGAGIINIRLKKNKAMGFNGSISAGISASKNQRWENGASLNFRNKKLNVYASYSSNYGKLESHFQLNRVVKDTAFNQSTRILLNKNSHVFKTGLDYTLSARSNIGILVNGTINSPEISNVNTTPVSFHPTGVVDKILVAENNTKQRHTNINSNINYTYRDTTGRTLVVNADYGYYNNKQDQLQPNTFFDATGKNELYRRYFRISSPTRIDIYAVKADYEQGFAKGRLGVGVKAGRVKTDNTFNQFSEAGSQWSLDWERSNFFSYQENVNAAYLRYSRDFNSVALQAGIRAEQTNVEGTLQRYTTAGDDHRKETSGFKRDYLDFFPSVTLTVAPKSANQFALAYSRRIDRPVYQDLNPFEYRINEYHYHKGSINLRPQYTNTVSLTHTFRHKLNTTLSYSHVKDVFGQLVDTAQGIKGYLVNTNIARQAITSLNISYPFQYKNYSLFTNVDSYHSQYKADFGSGRNINLNVWAVNIYAQNSYRFGKGWSAELSGFYSSPSIWQGTLKTSHIWSADGGIQKQLLKGSGTIKASMSDLFKSLKWSATSHFAGQDVAVAGRSDSRQFRLNFIYRFGNKNVKASRQYKTGLEEESNRTQSSGGLGH
jgi:hypothetical protein